MTGFGHASVSDGDFSADVVVRSVNGKHLKTKLQLGLHMPEVDERVAALVARYFRRGSVEVSARIDWAGAAGAAFNERIFGSYARELEKLRRRFGLASEIRADEIAQLPGAMAAEGLSGRGAGRVWRRIRPVLAEALGRAARMRASEGRRLAAALGGHCARIRRLLDRIEARAPRAAEQYRLRLTRRTQSLVAEAGAEVDPGFLAREIVAFAERSDITEELCRMRAHVEHFLEGLTAAGSGRRLEFIAQEMHREANTMASKANDTVMVRLVIDLRGEVDKIREQVLNLE